MRKTSLETEKQIIELLLKGYSYRAIARRSGKTLGCISRIVEDQRKKTPDFNQLRDHTVWLRKNVLTVFDEAKIHNLIEKLNIAGISFEELEDYIKLMEQIQTQRNLEADILFYATQIKQLEAKYNKSAKQLFEEFRIITENIKKSKEEHRLKNSELKKINQKIKVGTNELEQLDQRLQNQTAAHESLQEIGSEKIDRVAKFISQCETIGYDPEKISLLLKWRKSLQELNINPDKLGEQIKKHGTLLNQNKRLALENQKIKNDNKQQSATNIELITKNTSLKKLDQILESQSFYLPCKNCTNPLLVKLNSKQQYNQLMQSNLNLSIQCTTCNVINPYSAWEILSLLAMSILPESEIIQIQTP